MSHRGADVTARSVGGVADIILEIREANGNLQLEDLRQVNPPINKSLIFSPLQEWGVLGERRGSGVSTNW